MCVHYFRDSIQLPTGACVRMLLRGVAVTRRYSVCLHYCRPTTFENSKPYATMTRFSLPASSAESAICVHRPRQKDFEERSFSHIALVFCPSRVIRKETETVGLHISYNTLFAQWRDPRRARTHCNASVPVWNRIHTLWVGKTRGRCTFRCIMLKGQIDIFFFFFFFLFVSFFASVGTHARTHDTRGSCFYAKTSGLYIILLYNVCVYTTREHVNHPTSA